ncbi:competence protein ComGC [Salsuginibacillus halophilus]|uniref:ComG operon protein 3 n=1 Tax=Salsuginibacillus halophilus TaxID=517424 RepID=A0A2P8H820_9BACI|nr:competence type IV pilus major pilin ComGC [Salsuginibacillus halophilus]PSL42341.1 competence protein ComGC [Salsuginibacillus halophilus]
MKKRNEKGFTLIEMVIVLVIISVLLLVAVPSMVKNSSVAESKGCEATVDLVQAQTGAYHIEMGEQVTDLQDLVDEDFVDTLECPDGTPLNLVEGRVGIGDND